MSKKTIDAAAIAATLTPKGRETMQAIGERKTSFFDEGIQEHSGIWGECLVSDMGHKSSGVINRLKDLGLFTAHDHDGDLGSGMWWALTAEGAAVANYLAEQAESSPSTADDAAAAEFTAEPADEPEFAAVATKDWRGNYNTVFAPAAEQIAEGYKGVEVRTVAVSAMLKQTDIAGPNGKEFHGLLVAVEEAANAALRTWQKTLDRKDATDMEKFNQNRSFLAGFLASVAQRQTGSKKMPCVAFAKDMDRALRPEALKAGAAAHKDAA